ncbi:MAG: PTS sugar transporter subunit IIB [Candidatus Asgardarchaeia archaeon]
MSNLKLKIGRELKIITVCGVGMGSCLILRMSVEDVLKELGIPGRVEALDIAQAHGYGADIIFGQGLHIEELKDAAPITIAINDFVDKEEIKTKLVNALKEKGWVE